MLFIAVSWPTCCPYPLTHRRIRCRPYVVLGCRVVFRCGANIVGVIRTVRLSVYWLKIIFIFIGDYLYIVGDY